MDSYVTVSEAARIKKVTRQAIYLAIREGKLKAYQDGNVLKIFLVDLMEYDRHRYSREKVVHEGEPLFNSDKGEVSIEKAAQMLGVPRQKLYYAARTGMLKTIRKKSTWVVKVQDLLKYEKEHLNRNFTKKKAN